MKAGTPYKYTVNEEFMVGFTVLEGPAQHVPAVTTETVEWCAPAVLRLASCKALSHRVDPSKPARFSS